jgi:hypothetical protein
MNHEIVSKIIALIRYANAMGKLSDGLRADIYLLEKELKTMLERRWTHIMIHHSAAPDGRTFDWQATRRYQMSWRIDGTSVTQAEYDRRLAIKEGRRPGSAPEETPPRRVGAEPAPEGKRFEPPWKDIGYHYGVELIWVNPPQSLLTLTGESKGGYEILVGRNLDENGAHCIGMNSKAIGICFLGNFDLAPPPADQWAAGILFVRSLCRVLDIPISCVVAHRDYAIKTCPGKLFDMDLFRKDLK